MEEFIVDDSFTGESGEYDLALIVENHKIRVSKVVLCLASPVFRVMLKSEFKEKDQDEVELPGKNYHDFVEFLRCTYPGKLDNITSDNVYRILPLAFEYQVRTMEEKCQKLLIELVKTRHLGDAVEVCRHIHLAETYNLDDLRKTCISAASDFTLDDLDKAASEYQITENTLLRIHRLARRKQEMNRIDDDDIRREVFMNESSEDVIRKLALRKHIVTTMKAKMRALRLWYRDCQQEEELLRKIIKSMKGEKLTDIKEEYELLPETIKQQLDMDYNKN